MCVPAGRVFAASRTAEVAELADALASGASGRKPIGVQIPASAPVNLRGFALSPRDPRCGILWYFRPGIRIRTCGW